MKTHSIKKTFEKPDVMTKLHCKICFKKFSTVSSLRQHIKYMHGKILECPECGKCVMNLKNHLRTTHPGKKPFSCKKCAYSSNYIHNLKRHEKLHSKRDICICGNPVLWDCAVEIVKCNNIKCKLRFHYDCVDLYRTQNSFKPIFWCSKCSDGLFGTNDKFYEQINDFEAFPLLPKK